MENDILSGLDIDAVKHSIILVAGVGGAGGNALNNMIRRGINDVIFMACNTDRLALSKSLATMRIQLGEGLGAGNNPQKGADAAKESLDDIFEVLRDQQTRMLFITAGMGGGTGTGASPIIAKAAHELGILTVAVVTTPCANEGPIRMNQAVEGIEELRKQVDAILILSNESVSQEFSDMPYDRSFAMADDILASAVKSIAELITVPGLVNVDFADVYAALSGSGNVLLGTAKAGGEGRARKVAEESLNSLLFRNHDIRGAKNILLNIVYSSEHPLFQSEQTEIMNFFQKRAGNTANIVWGTAVNDALGEDLELLAVIAGFENIASSPAPIIDVIPTVDDDDKTSEQGEVVMFKGSDRYSNIDQIINKPAFLRLGLKFDTAQGQMPRKAEKKVVDENETASAPSNEGTLFG